MKKYFQDLQIYRKYPYVILIPPSKDIPSTLSSANDIVQILQTNSDHLQRIWWALISRVLSSLQISISEQVFYDSNPNKKIKNCLSVHFPYFLMDHFSRISRYIFESFYFSLVQSGTVTITADFFTCDYEHL